MKNSNKCSFIHVLAKDILVAQNAEQLMIIWLVNNESARNVELQVYNTLIRPTVTYASQKWGLKENMINKLMIFERRIMRKIFGPTRTDDGYWRIKTNQEINEILKGQNIIGFIKKKIKLARLC